jgi:hypothetical protein
MTNSNQRTGTPARRVATLHRSMNKRVLQRAFHPNLFFGQLLVLPDNFRKLSALFVGEPKLLGWALVLCTREPRSTFNVIGSWKRQASRPLGQ